MNVYKCSHCQALTVFAGMKKEDFFVWLCGVCKVRRLFDYVGSLNP
jgi:ribosomal protein L37AE/L43A